MKLAEGPYPSDGLKYPIDKEPLPYMTLAEIERRIKAGSDEAELYEALYLDASQIAQVLAHVKSRALPHWVYPMFVMAAIRVLGGRNSFAPRWETSIFAIEW